MTVSLKIKGNPQYQAIRDVFAEYRIDDYEVFDVRPHPYVSFVFAGQRRRFTFASTPKVKSGSCRRVRSDLRRELKAAMIESAGGGVPAADMGDNPNFFFEGSCVRVVNRHGEPWFVGQDVASILGYVEPHKAVQRHCKAAEILKKGDSPLLEIPPRGLLIISERDVYRLVMRSNLPTAERFEEWVVGTVLPTIRKTGGYGEREAPEFQVPQSFADALRLAADEHERAEKAEAALQVAQPKAEAFDDLAATDDMLCLRDAGKHFDLGDRIFELLAQKKWIYKRSKGGPWLPFQTHQAAGWLKVRVIERQTDNGRAFAITQTMVTSAGLAEIAKMLGRQPGRQLALSLVAHHG